MSTVSTSYRILKLGTIVSDLPGALGTAGTPALGVAYTGLQWAAAHGGWAPMAPASHCKGHLNPPSTHAAPSEREFRRTARKLAGTFRSKPIEQPRRACSARRSLTMAYTPSRVLGRRPTCSLQERPSCRGAGLRVSIERCIELVVSWCAASCYASVAKPPVPITLQGRAGRSRGCPCRRSHQRARQMPRPGEWLALGGLPVVAAPKTDSRSVT